MSERPPIDSSEHLPVEGTSLGSTGRESPNGRRLYRIERELAEDIRTKRLPLRSWLLVVLAAIAITMLFEAFELLLSTDDRPWLKYVVTKLALFISVSLLLKYRYTVSFAMMGLRKHNFIGGVALGLFGGTFMVVSTVMYMYSSLGTEFVRNVNVEGLYFLYIPLAILFRPEGWAALSIALGEELIGKVVLLGCSLAAFRTRSLAVLLTGAIVALAHAGSPWFMLLIIMLNDMLCSFAYLRTRNLWTCVAWHASYNVYLFLMSKEAML